MVVIHPLSEQWSSVIYTKNGMSGIYSPIAIVQWSSVIYTKMGYFEWYLFTHSHRTMVLGDIHKKLGILSGSNSPIVRTMVLSDIHKNWMSGIYSPIAIVQRSSVTYTKMGYFER